MVCNGVLTLPSKPAKVTPLPQIGNTPVLKFLNTLLPLRLEMAACALFTRGYFQQSHAHISEPIITD